MSILITGGAGYIGSHVQKLLLKQSEDVIIVDSLVTGHKEAVLSDKFYQGDIRDRKFMSKVFKENKIDAVIHFAASSLVGESMQDPFKYYDNNLYGTACLLEEMRLNGVNKIVFSSTAATYGEPKNIPITEDDETNPTNSYGQTKLSMEKMMKWFDKAYGIKYIALRYFNAAGADTEGVLGEVHMTETHLIPLILQVPLGKREYISVFGNDYDTIDGTCIRDYIHVEDLASAHYLAVKSLLNGDESTVYNLGNGLGYSVSQVIDAAKKVTGYDIKVKFEGRRAGDPAKLVASSKKISKQLGWAPKYPQIEKIIQDAWNFHQKHPNGF